MFSVFFNQFTRRLAKGDSVEAMGVEKGFDPNADYPLPQYAPTQPALTRLQQMSQAAAEISSLEQRLTPAIAPFAQTVIGYSPKQISQAIKGIDPDAQAKFLAGRALMPELASMRMRLQGGQAGIESIREMSDKSLGNIKAFQALVTPEVYAATQNYMNQWLNEAVQAAQRSILSGGRAEGPKGQRTEDKANYEKMSDEELRKLAGM